MNLYEYQAKDLFKKFAIPIPSGKHAAAESDLESDTFPVVVKAQVLTGGRGKAGGIKFANNPEELRTRGKEILAMSIKGLKVRSRPQ
ncbi:MAG: ADP-forming succinate--CoA ligase subunit beta, partial [Candidatus Thermoplasmatota archaeon]|nr:ADP-forming succinate--CoA ligase subunit beta [Candidatus Thermoplasmatota archaeon]